MTSTPSLLDSIRRTIEQRNLFSVRTRLKYVSALERADHEKSVRKSKVYGKRSTKNFKSPISSIPLMETRNGRLRSKVINEIISSEETYVTQLRTIQQDFMDDSGIKMSFSKRDFNAIFSNIPSLLQINETLLEDIKKSPSVQSISEAFLNYTPYLKLYSTYASGFQQAHSLYQANINQNLLLRTQIKQKEEKLNQKLEAYLITPIQRIPRYKLLLEQIVGCCGHAGRHDPDIQSIVDSVKAIDSLAHHMNEMIDQHEKSCELVKLNSWMGKCSVNLVQPGRKLIKSGIVQKVSPASALTNSLHTQDFYLILLTDQIFCCKIKGEMGSKSCLHPWLVLPLKRVTARYVDDNNIEVICENEKVNFTLPDQKNLKEWAETINESCLNLKRRSATLKRPSSHSMPLRKKEIKTLIKKQNDISKRVKRTASATSPDQHTPSPEKLRKFPKISERINEIVEYFTPSPKPFSLKSPQKSRSQSYKEEIENRCYDDIDPRPSKDSKLFSAPSCVIL